VFQGTAGLVEEAVNGPIRQVSAALVEVMERYISQGEMLSEIQALHSRYIFLKYNQSYQTLIKKKVKNPKASYNSSSNLTVTCKMCDGCIVLSSFSMFCSK